MMMMLMGCMAFFVFLSLWRRWQWVLLPSSSASSRLARSGPASQDNASSSLMLAFPFVEIETAAVSCARCDALAWSSSLLFLMI